MSSNSILPQKFISVSSSLPPYIISKHTSPSPLTKSFTTPLNCLVYHQIKQTVVASASSPLTFQIPRPFNRIYGPRFSARLPAHAASVELSPCRLKQTIINTSFRRSAKRFLTWQPRSPLHVLLACWKSFWLTQKDEVTDYFPHFSSFPREGKKSFFLERDLFF